MKDSDVKDQSETSQGPQADAENPGPFDRIHRGVHMRKKLGPLQWNIWDPYSDSTSTTSAEEGGQGGGKGRLQCERHSWPPAQNETKTQVAPPSCEMKPSNRGRSEWTQWQEQVKPAVSEGTKICQS